MRANRPRLPKSRLPLALTAREKRRSHRAAEEGRARQRGDRYQGQEGRKYESRLKPRAYRRLDFPPKFPRYSPEIPLAEQIDCFT